jgi:branched-chain amino acid transport system ATP-binding protein
MTGTETSPRIDGGTPADSLPALLDISGLSAGYGKHVVLDGVSLRVGQSEFVALLGHNGAGKSTLLRSIVGLVAPRSGRVLFDGADLTGQPAAAIIASGIALVPQGHGVFPSLSIAENLALAGSVGSRGRSATGEVRDFVLGLFPLLGERSRARAGSLSGGQRQMLAIAMALMARPRLVLLDEPSTGLAPLLVDEVLAAVKQINRELGTSVLLVEQDIRRTLVHADRVYVIKLGAPAFDGTPEEMHEQDWSELF